jgi:hypothetical protein
VYIAAGTVVLSFPLVRTADTSTSPAVIRTLFGSFYRLAIPAAAIVATTPHAVALLLLPGQYADSLSVLPWLAVAGLGCGTVMVAAIILLARRANRQLFWALGAATICLAAGLLLGWIGGAVHGLAIGVTGGSLAAAATLLLAVRPLLPRRAKRQPSAGILSLGLMAGVLCILQPYPVLWLPVAAIIALLALTRNGKRSPSKHRADRRHMKVRLTTCRSFISALKPSPPQAPRAGRCEHTRSTGDSPRKAIR